MDRRRGSVTRLAGSVRSHFDSVLPILCASVHLRSPSYKMFMVGRPKPFKATPLPGWNVLYDPIIAAWRTAHLRQLNGLECVDEECSCGECQCENCSNVSIALSDIADQSVRAEMMQQLDNVCPRLKNRLWIRCVNNIRQRRCRERKSQRRTAVIQSRPPATFLCRTQKCDKCV